MSRSIVVKVGGVDASSDGAGGFVSLASLGCSDAQVNELVNDISSRSITPETFEFIEYTRSLTDKVYREHYKSKSDSNEVERFGINTLFDKSILASSGAATSGAAAGSAASSGTKTSAASRFVQTEVDKIFHTDSEFEVMKEAIDYLFADPARKTVVMDIFAREKSSIKYLPDGRAEVHSVVLLKGDTVYADGTRDIFVIDPSNSKYSWHLANQEMQKFVSTNQPVKEVIVYPKQFQIYKADGPIGHEADEYRDCIDAAIKIALGFNKSTVLLSDIAGLATHPVIIHLSNLNSRDINYKEIPDHPIRIKQASDVALVEKFYMIQDVIGMKIEALVALCQGDYLSHGSDAAELAAIRREGMLMLDTARDYDTYLSEIASFNTDLTGELERVSESLDKLIG